MLNSRLARDQEDVLYHLGLSNGPDSNDLRSRFGDVKFVCMSGSSDRAKAVAHAARQRLGPRTAPVDDLCTTDRYSMYKVGVVLTVSHGMGGPSLSILLHELTKLLFYAEAQNAVYIRIGTSGGLGLPAGSIVISSGAVDGLLRGYHDQAVAGKTVRRPAVLDSNLCHSIAKCGEKYMHDRENPDKGQGVVVVGKTMSTDDFYESQGRLDGAICEINETQRREFLVVAEKAGVSNIEMEAVSFAAFTHHLQIPAAVVCTTLLDRLADDQVSLSPETKDAHLAAAIGAVMEYIASAITR